MRSSFTFLAHLLFVATLYLSLPLHASETVILQPDLSHLEIGPFSEVLEDPSNSLQFKSVRDGEHVWKRLDSSTLRPQFSNSTFWLKTSLSNPSSERLTIILDSRSVLVDYLDLFIIRGNGAVEVALLGDRRPFHQRQTQNRTVSYPLDIEPGEQVVIFMRQTTHDGLHESLTPTIWQPKALDAQAQKDALVFGAFYGLLGGAILYNLFIAFSTRQQGFLRFSILAAGILGWGLVFEGYAFQYLWPDSPELNNQILAILALASHAAFGLFAISYLNLKESTSRQIYLANWIPVILNASLIALPLLGFYAAAFASWFIAGSLTQLVVVGTSFVLIRQGSRSARYFVAAYIPLGIGTAIYYLHLIGWLAPNLLTQYGIQVGASLQVLLLSFGLADQMNTLKTEKLNAEQAARSAQLAMNSKLTEEVRLRTLELEELNRKLRELSITDELTGCFNRRHFNQIFEEELAHHRRQDSPLTFCMLDIDNFKTYNDTYGHQAGDQALQKISRCLQDNLKRKGDFLFRLGGEEFGVLLSMDQPIEKAVPFIEQLRKAIADLKLPHKGSSDSVLTASFGLVLLRPGSEISTSAELYARADDLLYRAKAEGRNRVAYAIE